MKTKTGTRKNHSRMQLVVAVGLALLAGGRASAKPASSADEILALTQTPDKAQRVVCVKNMKELGMSLSIWASGNGDSLPVDMLSMSNQLASPKLLFCPADTGRQPASDWASFTVTNLTYKFLAPSAKVEAPQEVVFLCPIHGNVTLMDGSVQSRVARTHPELFIVKNGKLYFGEPVPPVRSPNPMAVMTLDRSTTTASPTLTPSRGNPDIKMDEKMRRRYGLLPPTAMSTTVRTNPIPLAATPQNMMTMAPPRVAPNNDSPGIRMDARTMQQYGLLPLAATPATVQGSAGSENQAQGALKSTGSGENATTESETLKRDLRDKDPKFRRAAIEKLGRLLGEGLQVRLTPRKELLDRLEATQNYWAGFLAGSLKDDDEQVRMGAASVLYLCGLSAKVALPQLLEALQGTSPPLQIAAARTLGNLGTNAAAAVPALKGMLNKEAREPRFAAAQSLWTITRQAQLVVPVLAEALEIRGTNYVDTWSSVFAAWTLAEIGPDAKAAGPALIRLLEAKEQNVRVAAAAALVRISPDTAGLAEVLGAALQQDASVSYLDAQKALGELGSKSIPVLVKAASNPSPQVRRLSVETLGRIGAPASEVVPVLAASLKDSDEHARRVAAQALGKMAPESKAAISPLRAALKDTSGMVRAEAAVALVRLDPPANDAVAVLVEAISDNRDGTAYIVACNGAREISPAAVPTVLEFIKGAPPGGSQMRDLQKWFRTQEGAIDLLGRMGPNAKSAVPALIQALEDKRGYLKAAESLGWIGPDAKEAVPALKSALQDQEVRVRLNAAVALARIDTRDKSHAIFLTQFLMDHDAAIRSAAACSLGELGADARPAIPALCQLAIDDDDESVLREVVRGLQTIESDTAKQVRE